MRHLGGKSGRPIRGFGSETLALGVQVKNEQGLSTLMESAIKLANGQYKERKGMDYKWVKVCVRAEVFNPLLHGHEELLFDSNRSLGDGNWQVTIISTCTTESYKCYYRKFAECRACSSKGL